MVHEGEYFIFWRRDGDGRWRIDRYADITGLRLTDG